MTAHADQSFARRWWVVPAVALVLLAPQPVFAQQDNQNAPAEKLITSARAAYGPPPPTRDCTRDEMANEIVVCREIGDDSQFRVKSSREQDPQSRQSMADGLARAPDVAGPGIFKGPATASGCGLIGDCPPPPAYMIDFSTLPEAPEGSDADLIAKGIKRAD